MNHLLRKALIGIALGVLLYAGAVLVLDAERVGAALEGFLDEATGTVTLEDNQVLYLVELGSTSRASRHFAQKISRDDRVGVGAACSTRGLGGDATRSHMAYFTAYSVDAEFTLVLLCLAAGETSVHAFFYGLFYHLD